MNRRVAVVAVVTLLSLVAGCGDGEIRQPGAVRWTAAASPAPSVWTDQIAVDRDSGALTAPGFNDLIERTGPGWAASLDTTAATLLNLDRPFDGPVEVYLRAEPDEPVVTVTLTRLGDDSVKAIRYRVVFTRGADGRYRFVSGERRTLCHSGRGHSSFEAKTCS